MRSLFLFAVFCLSIALTDTGYLPGAPAVVVAGVKADPLAASVALTMGTAGCSGTIIGPRRTDGRWDVLTACHCTSTEALTGKIVLRDGREFAVTVAVTAPRTDGRGADLAWLSTDDKTLVNLPFALLAKGEPVAGAAVWHQGFGFGRHGLLRYEGSVLANDGSGLTPFDLDIEHGDSGAGIFSGKTGELVAVASRTRKAGAKAECWGGPVGVALKIRP